MPFPLLAVLGVAAAALGRLAVKHVATKMAARAAANQVMKSQVKRMLQKALNEGKKKFDDALEELQKKCKSCKPTRDLCKKLFGGNKTTIPGVYRGGAYSSLGADRGKIERHHIPAEGIGYPIPDGPSIQMDYADHVKTGTASWGRYDFAKDYRAEQKGALGSAGVMGAIAMDIFDIKSKYGDKYDAAITEAVAYAACLEAADAAQKGKK